MSAWLPCPHAGDYPFDIAQVRRQWAALHAVDAEALPDDDAQLHAWALFHAGEFERAAEAGLAMGIDGLSVANRATAAYAALVEPHEKTRIALLRRVHIRACAHAAARPDQPNAWYWQGFALARYAEGIHVARALAQGLGAQVYHALRATLALDPHHAYAHVSLAGFQAAVIDKVGPLIAAMTYGALADTVLTHLRTAQQLAPDSPAVLYECAGALVQLEGQARIGEAGQLLERAARHDARDATERLWVELARTSLSL